MRLTFLADNNAAIDFDSEWGFSVFIEADGKKILFDTGASELFLRNAARLKLDLTAMDYLVLSHGHYDHTWGLEPLIRLLLSQKPREDKPVLVAHPLVFTPKFKNGGPGLGVIASRDILAQLFAMRLSGEPVWITKNLVFLGGIERRFDYENMRPLGKRLDGGQLVDDYVPDDSALAYKTPKGLVIITGCSHAGICNIIETARRVCGEERIIDIIGGFHLKDLQPDDPQLVATVKYFKGLNLEGFHACHCVDLQAKIALARAGNMLEIKVGMNLEY